MSNILFVVYRTPPAHSYTLSLHDALPISRAPISVVSRPSGCSGCSPPSSEDHSWRAWAWPASGSRRSRVSSSAVVCSETVLECSPAPVAIGTCSGNPAATIPATPAERDCTSWSRSRFSTAETRWAREGPHSTSTSASWCSAGISARASTVADSQPSGRAGSSSMVSGSRIFMHSGYVRARRKAHAAAGHGPITCPHGTRHRLIRLSPHANTEQCRADRGQREQEDRPTDPSRRDRRTTGHRRLPGRLRRRLDLHLPQPAAAHLVDVDGQHRLLPDLRLRDRDPGRSADPSGGRRPGTARDDRRGPPGPGPLAGGRRAGRDLRLFLGPGCDAPAGDQPAGAAGAQEPGRSEEHTSDLQSRGHLVCRLL